MTGQQPAYNHEGDSVSDSPGEAPAPMRQKDFAEFIGVSQGRVSHYKAQGMPVRDDGLIDPIAALAWLDKTLDPSRRRGRFAVTEGQGSTDAFTSVKTEHERLKAEKTAAQVARLRGETIDKASVRDFLLARARFERDSWIHLAATLAPLLASEFGVPERPVRDLLEDRIQRQLDALADAPLEGLAL